MNKIQQEDVIAFAKSFPLSESLIGTRFLITGATGLIGSSLVHCLLALNKDVELVCPVRSVDRAISLFGKDAEKIQLIESELLDYLSKLTPNDNFQYIVHCACPTSGIYMSEHPVDTVEFTFECTRMLLDYSSKAKVKGVVYISSLEAYGQNNNDNIITENFQGYVDMSSARSSYPIAKRTAEYLCAAYAIEKHVPVKIARLTQTFGPGVSSNDNRVFAQFARSVIANTNIVLHTSGESSKPYCYTIDCVSAILYILLKGKEGETYNVANDKTYISIRELAEFLRDSFNNKIKVVVEYHPEKGYAPVTKLNLSVEKLTKLGWEPKYNLREMFDRLLKSITYN